MTTLKTKEKLHAAFDDRFGIPIGEPKYKHLRNEHIKSFIDQQRIVDLEAVIGMLEKIKRETRNFPMRSNVATLDDWNDGYDKAFIDAINSLYSEIEALKKMV